MPDRTTPDELWRTMREQHRRWAAAADRPSPELHAPAAAILSCSDARVPPSVVFDQQPGDLFVVRVAGNTATPPALASLTFATAHLGTRLVIVLGHTGCGAVTAAVSGPIDEHLAPIVAPIAEMIAACDGCRDVDSAVAANVRATMRHLSADDGPLGRSIRAGDVVVRGAVHDLRTGELVDVHIEPSPSATPVADSPLTERTPS